MYKAGNSGFKAQTGTGAALYFFLNAGSVSLPPDSKYAIKSNISSFVKLFTKPSGIGETFEAARFRMFVFAMLCLVPASASVTTITVLSSSWAIRPVTSSPSRVMIVML